MLRGMFCQFPFLWIYYFSLVVNPPERKLAKRTSVQWNFKKIWEVFIRWFNQFSVTTNLRFFQETEIVYLVLYTVIVNNYLHSFSVKQFLFPSYRIRETTYLINSIKATKIVILHICLGLKFVCTVFLESFKIFNSKVDILMFQIFISSRILPQKLNLK